MKKNGLIIGAGKIGRGFIAQLLYLNNWKLSFLEYSKVLVEVLNKEKEYTVHVLGNEKKNTLISNYEAHTLNHKAFTQSWESASLIFTSVGGKNLGSIAKPIAEAFKETKDTQEGLKNIITCENWKNPALDLKNEIVKHLNVEEQKEFDEKIGITEAVVMRIVVDSSEKQKEQYPVDVWVQDFWDLIIDKEGFIGTIPKLEYVEFIEDFGRFLERKIYTNNTSNATIAYFGYLKGYEYTADAANDPDIVAILDEVYNEVNEMLVKEFGVDSKEQEVFAQKAKKKYSDKKIVDHLSRHAADPIRKLGPNDRLIAPARLCLKSGVNPKGIVKTIVATLYYDYPEDKIAMELKELRESKGIEHILTTISELESTEPLYGLIMNELKEQNLS